MDLLRSLPLGLYLEQPVTWLHKLDPRVKFAWLMSFLTTYILANSVWRVLLVGLLILATLTSGIPLRVWRQQMGWLLMLSFFVLLLGTIMPDGMGVKSMPRIPADELAFAQQPAIKTQPYLMPQPTDYRYVLLKLGSLKVTRHSLDLAVSISTILFNIIYSTNLYLLTTAPEEITAGMESLMKPLRRLNWPVTEIVLTLTMSLRFIPLVLEEVQNLIRSVQTRGINWKKLGLRGAVRVWMMVAERLLENLLLRAEQMASAMMVRGFTSPNTHRVQWHQLRIKRSDWIALISLVMFWGARLFGEASLDSAMIRLGTDVVYIPRIQAAIVRFGDRFLQRVYTPTEQQDCGYGKDTTRRPSINQLAGRWAAKEAVAKALGTGWRGLGYTDIEIQRQPSGAPNVCLYRAAAEMVQTWGDIQWNLSLSHDGDYAIATAVLVCPDVSQSPFN